MTVRPFDWRDLPALHRYRNQCLFLDSTRLLTVGPRLIPARVVFSYFALSSGIFMYQSSGNSGSDQLLLGQAIHPDGKASARLTFLTPASSVDTPSLPGLVERIVKDIGQRGATHLLAEVDELDGAFEALRKGGFSTYARQRIWQLNGMLQGPTLKTQWKPVHRRDIYGIRSLYANLVPGLVQQVEQPPADNLRGMVYHQGDELLAYVDIKYGPRGIMLQPFIHPDVERVPERLGYLFKNLPHHRSRTVYICIRSYQSWLDPAIEDLGAEAGPRQAVMVRHLAIRQKYARKYLLPALERGHPEVSAPITRRVIKNYDTARDNR
jgi:hypothetical protein